MNNKIRPHRENDECLSVTLLAGNDTQTSEPQTQTKMFKPVVGISLSLARRNFGASSNVSYRLPLHFQNAPEARWLEI